MEFAAQEDNPNSAGEYVWTGFDYSGEPTPYNLDATNALNVPEGPEREKLMAELIAKEIKSKNATFEEMAKRYSKDLYAEKGGDWPVTERSTLLSLIHI